MPLVKIKLFAQITLPLESRQKSNLNDGDGLNVETVDNGILLKPVTEIDRGQIWARLLSSERRVKDTKASKRTEKQEEEDIARIIKQGRKQA